jgi:hypothetical protein
MIVICHVAFAGFSWVLARVPTQCRYDCCGTNQVKLPCQCQIYDAHRLLPVDYPFVVRCKLDRV